MNDLAVGTQVRIERDETRYPSKGTWPSFRGKTGTIVEINLGEYGVAFGKVTPRKSRPSSFDWKSDDVAWFQPHEVTRVARAQQPCSAAVTAVPGMATPESALARV